MRRRKEREIRRQRKKREMRRRRKGCGKGEVEAKRGKWKVHRLYS
jgi:hypothetical protein